MDTIIRFICSEMKSDIGDYCDPIGGAIWRFLRSAGAWGFRRECASVDCITIQVSCGNRGEIVKKEMYRAVLRLSWTFAALLLPAAGWAQIYGVAGDTFVSSANPTTAFGNIATMTVGAGGTALIQFDLSRLGALGVTAGQIQQATMVVFLNKVLVAGGIDVAEAMSPWSEGTVTFNTHPTLGAAFASNIPAGAQGTYVTFDVTNQVKGWVTTPSLNFGVAVSAAAAQPATEVFLDSKESTTTSHPALLDVILSSTGPAGPTGATGSVGPAGATGGTGATGIAGPAGSIGATGSAGPAGAAGATGAPGLAGPAGPIGATGPAGPAGAAGATGAPGIAGPAGPIGATGSAGPAGAAGATGAAGPAGPTGTAGANGATGAAGPAGPAGATGANGFAGPAGPTGATGPSGGVANAYTVGATQLAPLANGVTASSSAVLSFVTAGATVKLPPATTAGQIVVLISATSGFSTGFSAQPGTLDQTFDYNVSNAAQSTVGPYQTMSFISDGNHHWFIFGTN
jgi:hypothetical protein